jgi:regulator of replication initiation timing
MMKRALIVVSVICLLSLQVAAEDNYLHHRVQATILVADVDRAVDDLAQWAEEAGGYLLYKSSDRVIFRFPYTDVGRLRGFLESIADTVVELSLEAQDLRESILGIQSGIRSREEILEQNLRYIDQTDVEGTLAIEQEVMQLLTEIEQLKGKLRKLTVDRAYALAQVNLQILGQSLPTDIPSSFGWINTIDFYGFVEEGF